MKRILAVLCAVVILLAAVPVQAAAKKETVLEGADAAITLPENWAVLTRSREVLQSNAAQFDMTVAEAQQFMEQNSFYLVLYQPETGAEIYLTMFPSTRARQLGALDELPEEELASVRQEIAAGYDGWTLDSEVTEMDQGELTWISVTMHYGDVESRTDNRQLFTVWNGQEIYIDLYAGPEGLNEKLVRTQDELASALRCGVAEQLKTLEMENRRQQRIVYVGMVVGQMGVLLIRCVGLCLSVFLVVRQKHEDDV